MILEVMTLSCAHPKNRTFAVTLVANAEAPFYIALYSYGYRNIYELGPLIDYRPPLEGMSEVTMTMNARWIGPCKPGQKPGDVDIPGMPAGPKKR